MSEIENIIKRYERRKKLLTKSWYSYFNPGHLFIVQERERETLKLFKKHGVSDLRDKKSS